MVSFIAIAMTRLVGVHGDDEKLSIVPDLEWCD